MKTKSAFSTVAIIAAVLCSLQKTNAQWNLPGNANATANSKLGATAAGVPLRIFAGNANVPKIYINGNTGNVGIGTGNVAPAAYRLQVTGGDNFGGAYSSGTAIGVFGFSTNNGYGVYGNSDYTGVYGAGNTYGLSGYSNSGYGVYGNSGHLGVYGTGNTYGVYGYTNGEGSAIRGYNSGGFGVGGDFYSDDGIALIAESNTQFFAGEFHGSLWTTGNYFASDKNLKKNIQEFGNATSIINKLKPKKYEFRSDEKLSSLKLPIGVHYGLIAQELEEVLPNLVHENSHKLNIRKSQGIKPEDGKELTTGNRQEEAKETINIKSVNYTELIPIMIEAMQEQDAKIEALTQLVNKLSQDQSVSKSSQSANTPISAKFTSSFLKQNNPNPLTNNTSIHYNIPEGAAKAQLIISDNGRMIKQIQLRNMVNGVVTIDASSLSSGTYSYTLLVDGKPIESETMLVAH